MTLYRDMTTPQLAQHGLHWKSKSPHERRMIFALASRLTQEHERANRHRDKSLEAARWRVTLESVPPKGYINVGKPHVRKAMTYTGTPTNERRALWRCAGPGGVVRYGATPHEAYDNWASVMAHPGRNVKR